MIEKICNFLTNKIRQQDASIDDERAEVINYGLQLFIGEIPKIFIFIAIGFAIGIGKLTILSFLILIPLRMVSGGFHLKTHLGCIIGTTIMYCGVAFLAKHIIFQTNIKIVYSIFLLVIGFVLITLYAPADTENAPILRKKERNLKKFFSYTILTASVIIAFCINNKEISNILLLGSGIQLLTITRLAYTLTNNKYGYEIYRSEVQNN